MFELFHSRKLAADDVVALLLSSAVTEAASAIPFAGRAARAIARLERALPAGRRRALRSAMARVLVGMPASPNVVSTLAEVQPRLLSAFERAFTTRRPLCFDYRDRHGVASERCIEPQAMLVRTPLWYIVGWDTHADALKLFRTDRVRRPRVVEDARFRRRPIDVVTRHCHDARPVARRLAQTA